jgi:hypothetical protein
VLVKDIFWEEDATIILAMSVHEGRENVLAWHYDEHGIFVRLISSESGPTADSGLDLRPGRGRPTQEGWWAPVAQCYKEEVGP